MNWTPMVQDIFYGSTVSNSFSWKKAYINYEVPKVYVGSLTVPYLYKWPQQTNQGHHFADDTNLLLTDKSLC